MSDDFICTHQSRLHCRDGMWYCSVCGEATTGHSELIRAALKRAANPHAFNCGYVKDLENIKMVPVGHCNCGLSEALGEKP